MNHDAFFVWKEAATVTTLLEVVSVLPLKKLSRRCNEREDEDIVIKPQSL